MAIKKRNKKLYVRAVPVLIVGFMLLAVSAAMYQAGASSHSSGSVVRGLFVPLSNIGGRDGTAGIRAQKKSKNTGLDAFPSAGKSAGQAISTYKPATGPNTP